MHMCLGCQPWDHEYTLMRTSLHLTCHAVDTLYPMISLRARFMGSSWGQYGADKTQMGLMLATWTLLSGIWTQINSVDHYILEFTWSICTIFLRVPAEVILNDMGKLTTTRHKKVRYGYPLTHFPRDTIVAISQNIFSNVFSRMKSFLFWFEFHLRFFLRVQLKISEYWFSYWLCTEQVTSHNLNQCWPS